VNLTRRTRAAGTVSLAANLIGVAGLAGLLYGCAAGEVTLTDAAHTQTATAAKAPAASKAATKGAELDAKSAAARGCVQNANGAWPIHSIVLNTGPLLATDEIYTGLSGDLFGPDAGTAKLIAAQLAVCASTDAHDGIVTVYDDGGDTIAFGAF